MASEGAWPRSGTGRHTFEFRSDREERPAAAITEAVSWFSDGEATELEPLGDVVDSDWLRTVFTDSLGAAGTDGSTAAGRSGSPSLAFEYGDCVVTVEPGRFTVERAAGARSPGSMEAARD